MSANRINFVLTSPGLRIVKHVCSTLIAMATMKLFATIVLLAPEIAPFTIASPRVNVSAEDS